MVAVLLGGGQNPDTFGYLLHDAALKGHTGVAYLLIKKGADPKRKNPQGATPLHDAALAGHREVVELLLDQGAPIDERDTDSLATPLYNASSFGRTSVVQLLLERGSNSALPNRAGQSPLHAATANGHNDTAALLKAATP